LNDHKANWYFLSNFVNLWMVFWFIFGLFFSRPMHDVHYCKFKRASL